MLFELNKDWSEALKGEMNKSYFQQLISFLDMAYETSVVFPPKKMVFNALNNCELAHVKVVVLGQDPYHGFGQANGLSFSVNDGVKFPPSLKNIFKMLENDVGEPMAISGNLERWAKQGVLLLNTTLTVEEGQAASHQGKGWETFTDVIIRLISSQLNGVVFMLWGAHAQKKQRLIDNKKHLILQAVHPSPLSAYRGFLTCKHFSQTNTFLKNKGKPEIKW